MADQTASPAPAGTVHPTGRAIKQCRGCGADIIFVITKNDRHMPVNANPIRVIVLEEDGLHVKEQVRGYMPHHATCPKADEFRGPQPNSR